MSMTDFGKMVI